MNFPTSRRRPDGAEMSNRPIRDDWLLPILEGLVDRAAIDQLKQQNIESLWEAVVNGGLCTDDDIVRALADRFRVKVADLTLISPQAREIVPEHLARKYRILPMAASDSTLDIATADPHDLDCERNLAFATGR